MNVYILDKNFELLDICDDYQSIIWTTRYFDIGDFELYLPATDKNILGLKEDRYLVREKDVYDDGTDRIYRNVMIIEKIEITTSVENGNYLIVTGRCLKSILSRRIIWQQTTLYGNLEMVIRTIVKENAISPDITERAISKLELGSIKGFSETVNKQVTGDNLASFVTELCTTYGAGWDIYVMNGTMIFELYKGENRSYNQSKNPYVVFSNEFDNLLGTDYQYDKTNYKNVALVAGEGEGPDRRMVAVGNASDLDRYELFVDSRNSSSNNGEISETDYNNLLTEEGNEVLTEDGSTITENIEGEIDPSGNYVINVDYFLGDIVEVVNEYGIETTPRIIEVIESKDETGTTVIPTFSTWEV